MVARFAGQVTYARERLFPRAYINSYKRFNERHLRPTRAVWSGDNRTAGFRLCGQDSPAIRVSAASAAPISTLISPMP